MVSDHALLKQHYHILGKVGEGGFGAVYKALPVIRARVAHDISLPGLPHEKVLAAVVLLLDTIAIRVGNEGYARENGSFGLTTLRSQHVDISGSKIRFHQEEVKVFIFLKRCFREEGK